MFNDLSSIIGAGEVVGIVVMAILYIRSRIPKQTIEQQLVLIETLNKRLDSLEDENKDLHRQNIENQKAIADMQGQIKVYKELPLQDIAKSLKAVEKLPEEFERINNNGTSRVIKAIENNRGGKQPTIAYAT